MAAMVATRLRQAWSTADVEPRHALAYWVDTICKSFLEIDIDSPTRHQFRARLDQSQLGPATLHLVEADTQTIKRTRSGIARSRYGGFFLLQLRAGQLQFEQYGRESCIEVGDSVLIDCSAPYRLECKNTTRSVALRFSRDWLQNWIPSPENLVGQPLRSASGWSHALSAALATLDAKDMEFALPDGVVAEQIAALLALAAGPETHASSSSEKLLNRIRRTLRERCHETGLTPQTVADAHGISKRYLHHLFAQSGSTFGAQLMDMRLECAQRLLSDARYAALSVSEIATRCGFLEPSHFARRFRRAHGAGPVNFRTAQLHRTPPRGLS
jgi:AraC-like DNA-binding protein